MLTVTYRSYSYFMVETQVKKPSRLRMNPYYLELRVYQLMEAGGGVLMSMWDGVANVLCLRNSPIMS